MRTLEISREGRTPSQIVIGEGLAVRFEEFVPKCSSLFIITDSDVAVQYADLLTPYNIIKECADMTRSFIFTFNS
jgi:hypothetical protein